MATQYPESLGVPEELVELPFFDPVENTIHQSIDHLIFLLNQRRFHLITSLRDKRDEIRANQAGREQIDRQLVESRVLLEGLMTHNVLHSMQEKIFNELETKQAEIHAALAQKLSYVCNTHEIEECINRLGEIVQTDIVPNPQNPPNPPDLPTPPNLPMPQIQIQTLSVPNYSALYQPTVAVGNDGSAPGEFKRPLGLAVDPVSEYIYIVDNNNRRIQIFSQTGDYLNELTSTHLEKPWGILIHKDNIYVTDCRHNTILQFHLPSLTLVKRVGKEGSGKKHFNYPSQLAISPDQHIYIADQRNHRIQIMTTSLSFKNSLRHLNMSHPMDVKFSNKELFVLSNENPCIKVFSLSGEMIRSLVTKGKGQQIQKAWFFCLDAHNNIIISDLVQHMIKVFSPRGDLIHSIHQAGHEFHGIEIYNNKIISVSKSEYFCLQIFSA